MKILAQILLLVLLRILVREGSKKLSKTLGTLGS